MNLSDFDFHLPESSIAQHPVHPRDSARLLYIGEHLENKRVADLVDLARPGDVWVLNNSKVIPARLYGKRGEMKVEILLHKRLTPTAWEVFARPLKRLHLGDDIIFADGFKARVMAKHENGLAELQFDGGAEHMMAAIMRHGLMPLPPYIKRPQDKSGKNGAEDAICYQTVYAQREGSVAAPTAGLHFTENLLNQLKEKGAIIVTVTLHVGAGTFQPVKVEDISQHTMHSEWVELTADAADTINTAKKKGGRIVAVGTTSTRVLESVADETGRVKPWQGDTSIFITPGYRFKIVDALMTNFHLPKSTLFMLVSAFAGTGAMHAAYQHAIQNGYRFYSYGDACFIDARNDRRASR